MDPKTREELIYKIASIIAASEGKTNFIGSSVDREYVLSLFAQARDAVDGTTTFAP